MKDMTVLEHGLAAISEDHQVLMGYLDNLTEAAAAGESREMVLEILNNLVRRAEGHFAEEEQILQIHEYPDVELHAHEHEFLLAQVMNLRGEVQQGARVVTLSTAAFLRDWLREHIDQTDDRATQFLNEREPGHEEFVP